MTHGNGAQPIFCSANVFNDLSVNTEPH